ncbi:uncharacterized protein [Amphiura filiformis]|uniref:uncharacterized protein n=1 Tax=Amphiura filiformis TaxID=82378 RepID=UPI003B20E7CC
MSYAMTNNQVGDFFTGTGTYTWPNASYTGYTADLSSSMTITEKVFTANSGKKTNYHYFVFNGIPDYTNVASYTDWRTRGGNRKTIQAQTYKKCIPKNPKLQANGACTGVDGFVAITINGTPLWTWHTSSNTDAVATEKMDDCGGHADANGRYHYHGWNNFTAQNTSDDQAKGLNVGCLSTKSSNFNAMACPAPLLGIVLDGHLLYGPQKCDDCLSYDASGKCDSWNSTASGLFTNSELTNGGRSVNSSNPTHDGDSDKEHVFEYRLHTDAPYSINCFRGIPAPSLARCTGNNAANAKKREDDNLAKMEAAEEEAQMEAAEEEEEEEQLENKLRILLLKSLLDKRGKE